MSVFRQAAAAVVFSLCITCTSAFIFGPVESPILHEFSQVKPGTLLKLRLDFTTNDPNQGVSRSLLSLSGPAFELLNDPSNPIALPMASGPYPKLSSGGRALRVLKDAFYIGMNGLQPVPLEKGCWELGWQADHRDGKVVFGFDMPSPIQRGEITVPAGHLIFSFPVYTKETLSAGQAFKREVEAQHAKYNQEKLEELEKISKTNNIIMKAVHYRNAFAVLDKQLMSPVVEHIPEDSDVFQLPNGLLMVKNGSIWRKSKAVIGPNFSKIGTTTIAPYSEEV